MDDTEYQFILEDRIAKIQAINEQYYLLKNAYLSFSGGKDSTILHYLIDMALPNNNIPRVYANTGIEYIDMVKFVKKLAANDTRFVILNQTRNIKKTLNEYGYPFKSKEHSMRVEQFNKNHNGNYIKKYITGYDFKNGKQSRFVCPDKLLYQFEIRGKYNYSNQCCYKLKKDLLHKWQRDNSKNITITGMRNDEGGNRTRLGCLSSNNSKFHPLIVVTDECEWLTDDEFVFLKEMVRI
jgi:3'-phosphoadenosine 5'-phosphosulfate sulfotransferase (PAPS reductase)/FAD synthetase